VVYLAEHYAPKAEAFNIVLVSDFVKESGFTVEELFKDAMEAYKVKMVIIGRSRVKGNRYGVDNMIPEDLETITITREGLEWYKHS
jgi:hypothetical protein